MSTHGREPHAEEPSNEELRRLSRRGAIAWLGSFGALTLAACSGTASPTGPAGTASGAATATGTAGCSVLIPQETAGPYPLDLSGQEAFFRTDITEGRPGLPLELALTVKGTANGCAPLAGARVDVWQCDALGVYSGYRQPGQDTTGQTFLRGIQTTDDAGLVTFRTVYPGWYRGRITHIHFQVFLSGGLVATSQLAFPPEITKAVYATASPYTRKGQNPISDLADDGVFRDGAQYQLLALTGGTARGYRGTLTATIET